MIAKEKAQDSFPPSMTLPNAEEMMMSSAVFQQCRLMDTVTRDDVDEGSAGKSIKEMIQQPTSFKKQKNDNELYLGTTTTAEPALFGSEVMIREMGPTLKANPPISDHNPSALCPSSSRVSPDTVSSMMKGGYHQDEEEDSGTGQRQCFVKNGITTAVGMGGGELSSLIAAAAEVEPGASTFTVATFPSPCDGDEGAERGGATEAITADTITSSSLSWSSEHQQVETGINEVETKGAASTMNKKKSKGKKKGNTATGGRTIAIVNTGRWTEDEHRAFIVGLQVYGREWKKVGANIPSRTSAQVRSHAQKYFAKIQRKLVLQQRSQQHHQQQEKEKHQPLSSPSPYSASIVPSVPNEISMAMETTLTSSESVVAADDSDHPQYRESLSSTGASLPSSVQAEVEHIMAHPDTIQEEVEDTLQKLRERYALLRERLEKQQQGRSRWDSNGHHHRVVDAREPASSSLSSPRLNDVSSYSSSPVDSLQDEELIAVRVLQGGLPAALTTMGDTLSAGNTTDDTASISAASSSSSTSSSASILGKRRRDERK